MTAAQPSARAVRCGARARGTVRPPPSKSLTNRALNMALLAEGTTEIIRPLQSGDTDAMVSALERLGFGVESIPGGVAVSKQRQVGRAEIDCGASGTMLRFLTASLTTRPGTWLLDGVPRLRERPLGPLLGALRDLGADIECLQVEGFAPVRIRGGTLVGGRCRIDAGASSQFLSALLMASLRARQSVSIHATALTSTPYVELTLQTLTDFGSSVGRSGSVFTSAPHAVAGRRLEIEADYSSACYFGAAAAATGGRVILEGLRPDSRQGDARFFSVLERMGARCRWIDGVLEVSGSERLTSVSESFSDMPDQVPTLAVLAPFAEGTTRVREVGHLRHKESDRLEVVARELDRAGISGIVEEPSAISVPGIWARAAPPSRPVSIDSADDHRIAMSFALLGLRRPGLSILEPAVVAKSYPDFWNQFSAVCER